MKQTFKELFQNKANPETVYNRYNLPKEDRAVLDKIINNHGDNENNEDNLSKVERAFIFDYTKNYDDYQNVLSNIESFNSCIVISDIYATNNKYVNIENLSRMYGAIGLTVSSLTCNNDDSFNAIKQYMIEVPVEDFYGLSNNNRVYFGREDLSADQQIEYITKIIDEKFPNLKEGEEIIPNGYIIPIPALADDWGFITKIKKINNIYMAKHIRNGIIIDDFISISAI